MSLADSEERCPTCGRWPRVFPSLILRDEGSVWCGDLVFHGFTLGDKGTGAVFYAAMRALATSLRDL